MFILTFICSLHSWKRKWDYSLVVFCRIVESVGKGVTEFVEGDHVLTVFTGECKTCIHCASGKSNMCQVLGLERRGVMHSDQRTRFSVKGEPVYHYCAVSSFSEYTVVHSGCAVKVSPHAPLEKICLLSCGVAAGKRTFSMILQNSACSSLFLCFCLTDAVVWIYVETFTKS